MIESVLLVLLMLVLFLLRTGIDVIVFFVVVRLATQVRRSPRWVLAFNAAGAPLIDRPLRAFGEGLARVTGAPWRAEAKLAAALFALGVVRLLLI